MRNLTTRVRIALLVIAAAVPALAMSIYTGLDRREAAIRDARGNLGLFAAQAAREMQQTIDGVRQLLVSLAVPAESLIDSPEACTRFFKRIVVASERKFHTLGVHGADGHLVCNSETWTRRVDVNDRRYYHLARNHQQFAIGSYQVGRVTGSQGVNFGYPIRHGDGTIMGVVFAALNLDNLNLVASTTPLPEAGMLTLFDSEGTILLRHPESAGRIGEKARNPAVLEAIRQGRNFEFEAVDTQDVTRLFAFRTIGANPDGRAPLHLLLSIPMAAVLADANRALANTIAGILVATLVLLLVVWQGAEFIVLDKVRTMLGMMDRIHDGDLSVRTRFRAGAEELSSLGASLDRMAESLEHRDSELKDALQQLREQAMTDALTGLYNRRFLWSFLERELLKAGRAGTPVSVLLLDLDLFKHVNDALGHDAGDQVLRHVADLIRRNVRGSDVAIRSGGEEIVIVMPEAAQDVAAGRAELIRRELEASRLEYLGQPIGPVTASFGIAVFPDHARDPESLVRRADRAMYRAKQQGRNRVVIAQGAEDDDAVAQARTDALPGTS